MTRVANTPMHSRSHARRSIPSIHAQQSVIRLAMGVPIVAMLFILTVLIPTDLSVLVGPMRLTFYRLVLLFSTLPCAYLVFSGRRGGIIISDWLVLLYAVWGPVALLYHHGPEVALESGGIHLLEAIGPYLLARAAISTESKFRSVVAMLSLVLMILIVFTILESVTGNHLIRKVFAAMQGRGFTSTIDTRFGFHRAFGPFDHPILYGVFAASVTGMSWYSLSVSDRLNASRIGRTLSIVVAAMTSLSAGAMAAIMVQFTIIGWERVSRTIPRRWLTLSSLLLLMYIGVDMLSNRSGMKVLLSYLTFSPATAYARLTIWEFGHKEVLRHPLLGIGMNDWVRPVWMTSGSVDNFWLLNGMRYGLPGGLAILGASLYLVSRVGRQIKRCGDTPSRMVRFGWVVSMTGVMIAACTVHFWNASFVYFGFLLGCGASLAALKPRGSKAGAAIRPSRTIPRQKEAA